MFIFFLITNVENLSMLNLNKNGCLLLKLKKFESFPFLSGKLLVYARDSLLTVRIRLAI